MNSDKTQSGTWIPKINSLRETKLIVTEPHYSRVLDKAPRDSILTSFWCNSYAPNSVTTHNYVNVSNCN